MNLISMQVNVSKSVRRMTNRSVDIRADEVILKVILCLFSSYLVGKLIL